MNFLQKYRSKLYTISVLTVLLFMSGCWEFLSIDQPDIVDPNSTFEVPITISFTAEDAGGRGYFGILLPIGWSAEDSISYSGVHNGNFIYSSEQSDSMEAFDSAPYGYYWWISISDSVDSLLEGTISFTTRVHTDNQTGLFFLDYIFTDRFAYGGYVTRSGLYPISVSAPMTVMVTNTNDSGEGSLRQALSDVSNSGEILFDLSYPAIIILDTTLMINRSVNITGPESGELTISGNNRNQILDINPNLTVNISNVILTEGGGDNDGGAINCSRSILVLNNVTISNNSAKAGGGIFCGRSQLSLTNVTISNNSANYGGGIYCSRNSNLIFNNEDRCNIYLNKAFQGNDLYSENSDNLAVVVDTFTVLKPTEYHASPLNNFTFDILNGKITQYDSDIYVKSNGDNNKSGTSWSDAVKSISFAFSRILADSLHPHTIFVDNGVYSPSTTVDRFPLMIPDYVTLSGTSREKVILDAEQQGAVIQIQKKQTCRIENVTITGGNESGILCRESILEVNNVKIENNSGEYFGGIFCDNSLLNLTNSIIINNTAESGGGGGGGIRSDGSEVNLSNVLISSNYAINGGGIEFRGNLTMTDVKILGNTAGYVGGGITFSSRGIINLAGVTIAKNMARKGGGIYFGNNAKLYFDPENRCNIYSNRASSEGDDILYSESDSTKIAIVVDTFTVLNPTDEVAYPLWKYDFDILNDISGSTDINAQSETLPTKFTLNQNYPNPFNPKTVIRYSVGAFRESPVQHVDLSIYNILGQKVATLVSTKQTAGNYNVTWNAGGFASGIYFYRIHAGDFVENHKMVLIR